MNTNNNISIWRGSNTPPTKFHLWLKNNKLYHFDGIDWIENKVETASYENDGLMSKEDKERLDNLVYDGLDSTDIDKALSANLGNILLNKINDLKISAYKVKGSVENFDNLPTENLEIGDVYNILNLFYIDNKKYPEGTNVVWTGSKWDPLGGTVDFSDYSTIEQVEVLYSELNSKLSEYQNNTNQLIEEKSLEATAALAEEVARASEQESNLSTSISDLNLSLTIESSRATAAEEVLRTSKVDKVEGKSLVSDDQIVKLTNLDNQDDITSNIADAKKAGTDALSSLDSHVSNVSNPHKVTKDLVGLGNVNNTSDLNKPVSTATRTELNKKVDKIEGKGLSTEDYTTADKTKLASIANGAQVNSITGVKGGAEESYRTGNVNITAANLGLGNVNNTSDADKPISTATQTALNNKVDKIAGKGLSSEDYTSAEKTKLSGIESGANKTIVDDSLSNTSSNPVQNKIINAALSGKANTAHSHTFSQILEKPTTLEGYGITDAEVKGASNTALASANSYTDNKIASIINGAPETLNTLKEIADAMEENESVVEALNQAIGTKATKDEFTAHSTNTDIHINSEERIKWNESYNKRHIHTNKSVLDSTTASYTSEEKTKLAGIETNANKTIVDTDLSSTSTNPVQNKIVTDKLNTKVDKVSGKGLSTNDYTTADKNLVATISSKADKTYVDTQLTNKVNKIEGKGLSTNDYTTEEKTKLAGVATGANKTVVDTELSTTSTNPVQNKVISSKLDTKVDKVTGKGLSTNDYTTEEKNLVATIPSKASEEYVDKNIELLAKQRTSFITPCFSDCDSTHEAKCKSITLAGGELGFGFKSIFSVTIKIAENLSLLNYTPTYLHIKDLFGNSIGVSMNGVKQMQNLGKYATWFFDSTINTSGGPIVLSLHTTNVASSASDSNRVMIIAHVNQSEGMEGCSITDKNGTSHTNWTPALGINIVDLSAIYPQIKELQKYRMAYATSELPDISTTGHKANIKEICIGQNTMGISLVSSVSLMVASDNAYSGALYLRVHDINDNLVASSNNSVNLSQNLGKYVTWYFTPFQLNTDAEYRFTAWNGSNVKQVMRIHVASGKNEGVTCLDQNDSPHTDYCPALGINISAIFADDLRKSIKEVNLALGNAIVTKAEISYVDNKVSPKADKTYVDEQLGTKVDKVSGKGLSSNDFSDRYKFATQTFAEILERKNETQNGVGDIVSNICLGTLWEKESLLNVGAEIPLANHYTFRHKVDKIDGNNQEYIELSCNTYYVDYYTGGSNLKELFIRVPSDEHSYILLHCRQHGDGHGYRWIVKEKISGNDDVHDTAKIPYLFSPLRYTDDKVKELQSKITALETRIAALEAK